MVEMVISAVGPDRPGIVDAISAALSSQQASIADSRMVNLRGRFALVMLIEAPDEAGAQRVQTAVEQTAQSLGLTATIQNVERTEGAARQAVPYRIRTYAMDQVGLVHRITHALHLLGANIEDLSTRLEHAPHTGAPIFSMDMVIALPKEVPLKRLREELEKLCTELNCDLDIDRV
jgi:glycine cleavage system transcriptional repressor